MLRRSLLLLSMLVASSAPAMRSQTAPFQLKTITYASPDQKPLVADLYIPPGETLRPVVLYLHGGAWWSGDRKQLHRQAEDLATRGVFGMAVEYRLAPDTLFPAQLSDVDAAVQWIHDHASQYHLDLAHVALMGSSAGGHLAMMYALRPHPPSLVVEAVVAFNPVLDLSDEPGEEAMVNRFLGKPCAEIPTTCNQASPLFLARSGFRTKTRILILHGTADRTVPYRQAERTVAALRSAGNTVELFTAPDAAHTFWSRPEWYAKSLKASEVFLGWPTLTVTAGGPPERTGYTAAQSHKAD